MSVKRNLGFILVIASATAGKLSMGHVYVLRSRRSIREIEQNTSWNEKSYVCVWEALRLGCRCFYGDISCSNSTRPRESPGCVINNQVFRIHNTAFSRTWRWSTIPSNVNNELQKLPEEHAGRAGPMTSYPRRKEMPNGGGAEGAGPLRRLPSVHMRGRRGRRFVSR